MEDRVGALDTISFSQGGRGEPAERGPGGLTVQQPASAPAPMRSGLLAPSHHHHLLMRQFLENARRRRESQASFHNRAGGLRGVSPLAGLQSARARLVWHPAVAERSGAPVRRALCFRMVQSPCPRSPLSCLRRFLLHLADKTGGIIVTNDNFREFVTESVSWREIITKR